MTLQQIKAQIYNLGTYKQQKIEAYGTLKKELWEKVRNQVLYQSEAELRLENFKKEANQYSDTEFTNILAKLENFEQTELEKIKSEYETVTADSVAELNLLSTMKVSEQELLSYLEKYKRNPLAIKKLHEIGAANNIALPSYILKETRLAELLNVFKRYAKSYHDTPIVDSNGSASDLAFMLVLASDELNTALEAYSNHFDTALGLSEG
jgi:raw score 8.11